MGWRAGIDAGIDVGWLGLDVNYAPFPGYGPDGVATFALDIEDGFTVTYSFKCDVIPRRDGTEQRIATLQRPAQNYRGSAKLLSATTRLVRARLARYAAQGAVFLLGLPHEALTLAADSSGSTLTVNAAALALCDWAQVGQRVVVRSRDLQSSVSGVVQSASGSQIVLDVAPGIVGNQGGMVMPAMAIYLEPQQDFAREITAIETWKIAARAAIFDFAPPPASLDLQTATGDAALAGAKITARIPGIAGNLIAFELDALITDPIGGALVEILGTNTIAQMKGGTDTLAALATLLNTSSNVKLTGTYTSTAVIATTDGFIALLAGGTVGAMGAGSTLTLYAGHPVWDRGIENDGTIDDAVQSLVDIIDLGGVPVAISNVAHNEEGRTVAIASTKAADWQWTKLFLATVRGRQRMFWLATYRPDFTPVSYAANVLTVRTDDSSDITAYWPTVRDRLMLRRADGSLSYAQITAVVDHGDGTQSLTLTGTIGGSGTVTLVSWLEPCRFDSDDFDVSFKSGAFALKTTARAHVAGAAEIAEVES